jgi:hypothetical protein
LGNLHKEINQKSKTGNLMLHSRLLHHFPNQVPDPPLQPVVPEAQPSAATELPALNRIMRFASFQILLIATAFVFLVWIYIIFISPLLASVFSGQQPTDIKSLFIGILPDITVYSAIGASITTLSLLYLWEALRRLEKMDELNFSASTVLTLLLIISSLAGIACELVILNYFIPQFFNGSSPSILPLPTSGSYLVLQYIAGTAEIAALVGFIGGEMLGLWRVGSRYNEVIIKVGAIFFIIPLLDILAPFLVMAGVRRAKKRYSQ